MGASYSVEENKPNMDLEAPELEEKVLADYDKEYEEIDTSDTRFFYWWY